MKKRISIGISNFKELVNNDCYFVDKTLLIKEFIDVNAKIVLIPRPRRFGKTLNMSMIKYFFDKTNENNRELFNGLNIEKEEKIMERQGRYPVIYITFKDEKYNSYEKFEESIKILILNLYNQFNYILNSNVLDETEVDFFSDILSKRASIVQYSKALAQLVQYIHKYYESKVILLIDEYDVPIQSGFVNGYYNEVIEFMRNFLSGGLKDNDDIEKAMITGVLRIAKESIFSGLNNLEVSSIIGYNFSDKFGFTEYEVEELLNYYGIEEIENIKQWYNGYIFGSETIYNPWSILNYVAKPLEGLKAHWVNTSSDELINLLIAKSGEDVKKDLEILIEGEEIIKNVNDDIVMDEIKKSSENLWSFLLFTGYLKVTNKFLNEDGELVCKLAIPNREVKYLFKNIIRKWFTETINKDKYDLMLKSLISGDVRVFSKMLRQFVLSSISYFDVGGSEGEKVYHAFVLGLLVALSNTHEILSNRESGYGRYDIMIIPRDIEKLGIIIEFKKLDEDDTETMDETVDSALKQIEDKKYKQQLLDRGIKNIMELGIVFRKKEVLVKEKKY